MSARPESLVRPEYGPALPQLLRERYGVSTRVGGALGVVAIVIAVAIALVLRSNDIVYVHGSAPTFNLRYARALHRSSPRPGVLFELVGRRGGLFLQSLTIRPLRLPPYHGSVSGLLPVFAEPHVRAISHRFPGFDQLDEGKARISGAPGYQVGFKAKLGARTLYGREVLVVPGTPGARDGVVMTVIQTNAAGAHSVADVGSVGAMKKAFRSFTFGTTGN